METVLFILAILFTKHLFVDWIWQPQAMAVGKGKSLPLLTIHCLMHWMATVIIVLCINAYWFPIAPLMLLFIPTFDLVTHWIIDFCSSRTILARKWTLEDKKLWNTLGVDQYFHYLVYLLITALLMSTFNG